MNSDDLGLPLEYMIIPEYFDAYNILGDSSDKNLFLLHILRQYKVGIIFDMTCGTGAQVFYLHAHGFNVTGSDFSPKLLNIARAKAKNTGVEIEFIDGDMRNLILGKSDAVITMFNAIGHLSKPDFKTTLNNVNANLQPGGLYIFDIYNLAAMTSDTVKNLAMDIKKWANGAEIHNVQYSKINEHNGLLTSFDKYMIQQANGEKQELENSFTLQIYTASELELMLTHAGFEVIKQYSMDGTEFVEQATESILTIARKL